MFAGARRWVRARLGPTIDQRVGANLTIAARILPADPTSPNLVTPLGAAIADLASPTDFPLPPPELRVGVSEYLELGEQQVEMVRAAVRNAGVTDAGRVLDFGCGSARMTRWFLDESRSDEVWGVDFNVASILWNRTHLSPPFHFITCTSQPSLPFEDGYFGVVVAGSVFTHMAELADAWLLELRRVTRPGGVLYLTIQDAPYIDEILADHRDTWMGRVIIENRDLLDTLGQTAESVAVGRQGYDSMVFHDRDALVRRWSVHLDLVEVLDRGLYGQTAVVLRKRQPGS